MLNKVFHLTENHTTVKTECIAGVTTFMTMAYILAVNPNILSAAGMDPTAVLLATCLASFLGTMCMGMMANLPFALSAGMGLNAFFTYQAGNVIRLDPIFSQSYSDLAALTNEFKNRYVMSGDSDVPAILDYVHNSISITDAGTYASYNYTGKRVAKGDFIRLKSIACFNGSCHRRFQTQQRFHKRALSGAVLPHNIEVISGIHGERQVFDHRISLIA